MKIRLFCCAGMSTSLVVARMEEAAKKRNISCDIAAFSVGDVEKEGPGCDAVLIGPQVAYMLGKIKDQLPGVPVEVIKMQDYGMANGDAVLTTALSIMESKEE